MSRLIKGVIQDCQDVGIPESELLTLNEEAELKQKWGIDLGERRKKLWSIFTDDMDHCMYTGQYGGKDIIYFRIQQQRESYVRSMALSLL